MPKWPEHGSEQKYSNAAMRLHPEVPCSRACSVGQSEARLGCQVSAAARRRYVLLPRSGCSGSSRRSVLQVSRKTWPTPRSRLPTPKELKTLAMPAQEGFGLDVDQSVSPGK